MMGESYLSGAEFKEYVLKEQQLFQGLQEFCGKQVRLIMKNDEISVLVDCTLQVADIVRHENRIETGHLSMDDVYFELVNPNAVKLYFPLVQFKGIERFGSAALFIFDTFRWSLQVL